MRCVGGFTGCWEQHRGVADTLKAVKASKSANCLSKTAMKTSLATVKLLIQLLEPQKKKAILIIKMIVKIKIINNKNNNKNNNKTGNNTDNNENKNEITTNS